MASSAELQLLFTAKDATAAGFAAVKGQLGQLDTAMAQSEKKASGLGTALGTVGKVAGAAAVAGVGALAAGLAASVKTAADFQQALANTAAATGATSEQMAAMRQEALGIGKDTSKSASEAAAAMGELVKAGLDVTTVVQGAARATVQMAEATGIDMPEAANLVSNAMNTFKASGIDAAGVANLFAKAANASAIDVRDMGFSLQAVGPVAAQAGLTMEDFSRAIGIMGNFALKGSDAGTSLKTMLLALEAPSQKARNALGEFGVEIYNAQGQMLPFRTILGNLQDAFKGVDDETRNMALTTIFGSDAIRAANILVGQGVEAWDAFGASMAQAPSIAEQSATRLNTLSGQMEILKGTLETIAITIGSALLPKLTQLAQAANQGLTWLTEQDWSGVQAAATAAFDAIVNAATRVVDFVRDVWPQIRETARSVWQDVQEAATPVLDTLVTRAGDVVSWVQEHWPPLEATLAEVFDQARTSADSFFDAVRDRSAETVAKIQEDWPLVQDALTRAFENSRPVVSEVMSFVISEGTRVRDFFVQEWPNIQKAAENVFEGIKAGAAAMVGPVVLAFQQIRENWDTVSAGLRTIAESTWANIKGTIDLAVSAILGALGLIIDLLAGDWAAVWARASSAVGALKDAAAALSPQLAAAAGLAEGLAGGIRSIGSAAQGAIGWVQSLGNALSNLPGADQLAHLIGRSPSPLAIGIESVGDAAEGATPPLLAFAQAAQAAADAGAAAMAAMAGETAHPISSSEQHPQTGITVQTVQNYAGVAGLTQSTVSDSFGTFTTFSVPDWLLEAYGQNLEAVLRDIAAGQGRFRSGGRQMASGGVLDDLTLWYQPRTGRHGSMAETGPEYVVPAGGMMSEAGMERAMVRALSRAPVDASQHVYLTRGTQLDADRAQRSYLARRRTEAGRRR